MAISYVGGKVLGFVGTTSVTNVSLTDLTGGSDTAPSAGDFVVVYYGTGSNTTARAITVNSSYTNLTKIAASDTYDANLVVGYKRMGSTPDTSVEVSGTLNTADPGAVVVHVFRGVDETTPLDVTSVTATGTNSVLCNPGAITPSTAGAWIVAGGSGAHIAGVDTYSSSDLTSFRTVGANDTFDVTVGAGLKTDWTSGPFDPAAFTWSDTSASTYSWAAYTLALRPSPDELVIPTGVSASAQVNGARVPTDPNIGYVGGTTLGFLGTTSTTDVSLTSLTGGVNSSPQEGDLVVVYYGVASIGEDPLGISVGSSYTNLGVTFREDTYSVSMAVAYKVMGSTPDTSVTLSQTFSTANAGAAVIHVFSGVNTTTPLDVTSTTASAASTAIPNPPAITPVTAGAWIVAGGAGGHIDGTDTYASSDLSSFRTVGSNDTYDVSVGAGAYSEWTSGAFDPAAFTWSGTNNDAYSSVARTIALRPAVVGATVSLTGVSSTGQVGNSYVPQLDVIEYVGGKTEAIAGTTTATDISLSGLTGGLETVAAAGDLVVVYYGVGIDGTVPAITVNSDYTRFVRMGTNGSSALFSQIDGFALDVAYKLMGATPDSVVNISGTGDAGWAGAVVIHVFRGVDPSQPIDVSPVTNTANGALPNPSSITPVTTGAWVVAGAAAGHKDGVGTFSSSDLSSFRSVGSDDDVDVTVGAGVVSNWTSGAVDPAAFTFSGSSGANDRNGSSIFAIRPTPSSTSVDVSVTGVTATAAVGTVTVTGTSTTDTTGVSATGQVGDVVATGGTGIDVPVTGVASDGQVGAVTAVAETNALAEVTGVSSTGQVGSIAITATALVQSTGASATGQVGTATAFAQIDVVALATGVSALGAVGTITATGTAVSAATGAQASGAVGTVIVSIPVTVLATGVSATGAVGDVAIILDQLVLVTGVDAAGFVGELTATGTASIDLTGVSSSGEVGTAIASIPVDVGVSGVSSSAAVGDVVVAIDAIALPLGVSATGLVNGVVVWGPVIPGDTAWAPLDPSAAEAWAAVSPPSSQVWTDVDPSGIDNWTEVVPSSGSWTPIET
jgi:hypothetical protein